VSRFFWEPLLTSPKEREKRKPLPTSPKERSKRRKKREK
jgi:hypothetical protein